MKKLELRLAEEKKAVQEYLKVQTHIKAGPKQPPVMLYGVKPAPIDATALNGVAVD